MAWSVNFLLESSGKTTFGMSLSYCDSARMVDHPVAGVVDRLGCEGDGVAVLGLQRPSTGHNAAKATTPNSANTGLIR